MAGLVPAVSIRGAAFKRRDARHAGEPTDSALKWPAPMVNSATPFSNGYGRA